MAGLSVWNGAQFVDGEPRIWNGSAFVAPAECHVWDGSEFVKVWPTSLPIEHISAASAGASTVSMPTHQAGDLIIAIAGRTGSTTAPTAPEGWTSSTGSGGINTLTYCSLRIGWRIAASASESVGTWTNASSMQVLVYRNAVYEGAGYAGSGFGAVSYPARTAPDDGWGVRAACTTGAAPALPSGWTSRTTLPTALSCDLATPGAISPTSTRVGGTGSGQGCVAVTITLQPT